MSGPPGTGCVFWFESDSHLVQYERWCVDAYIETTTHYRRSSTADFVCLSGYWPESGSARHVFLINEPKSCHPKHKIIQNYTLGSAFERLFPYRADTGFSESPIRQHMLLSGSWVIPISFSSHRTNTEYKEVARLDCTPNTWKVTAIHHTM